MIFLSLDEVAYINRRLISNYGGTFAEPNNLRNRNSLEWALDIIQRPFSIFLDFYPEIGDKAAVIFWTINADHVFIDGNKRTSIVASQLFLRRNGYTNFASPLDLRDIALRVANPAASQLDIEQVRSWFNSHIVPIPPDRH